ncbi:MAG: monofunctional biosynthetic peptidoglycan transglycosylase [Tannerella sp.]|jgi:monofunctional biosynthetic peptidoglycan transglycosylase|nr:monofunctional biosynthetic peptidoglycan transglycosylase [Tannerella sp.]
MKTVKRIFILCRNLLLLLVASAILAVVIYKYVPVYYTPLMFIRLCEKDGAGGISHHWTPIGQISQSTVQAVVASEDNLFMEHHGFDRKQIDRAIEEAKNGRRLRGASTISQQTAKNVFLWPGRSYLRKGLEACFTLLIEWIWGKERIMEVYLNSIEMGTGIYGVEAASLAYFEKRAYELTPEESALLAISLPAPRKMNPKRVSAYMQGRQRHILSLMKKIKPVNMGYRYPGSSYSSY